MTKSPQNNPVNKWWLWVRPYWHVASFFIIITFIGTMKWSAVEAYSRDIARNTQRIENLEQWQFVISQDIATVKQEVHDLHEQLVPKKAAFVIRGQEQSQP